MVGHHAKELKNIECGETSSRESVPNVAVLEAVAFGVEILPDIINTKRIRKICLRLHGMVGHIIS